MITSLVRARHTASALGTPQMCAGKAKDGLLVRAFRLLALSAVVAATVLISPFGARAEIYVVHGSGGSVTFTNRKPAGNNFRVFSPSSVSFSRVWTGRRFRPGKLVVPAEVEAMITRLSAEQGLEKALVKAVVHAESAFQQNARSPKGAMGLMQLMPGTAARFNVRNAYHAESNVLGGTMYLRKLLDRYNGDERLAIAAYNAGEGAVDDYQSVPPYSETQQYVRRVLELRDVYKCIDAGGKDCWKR